MKKIDKVKIAGTLNEGMKKIREEGVSTRKKLGTKSLLPRGCETLNHKLMREGKIKRAEYKIGMK